MKKLTVVLLSFLLLYCSSDDSSNSDNENPPSEALYFPPINSNVWETVSPSSLEWNTDALGNLQQFLDVNNTKSFMMLYKGKKVIELYFDNHNENSNWYWASAGKTLTTAAIGIAKQEGLINIDQPVSNYLGNGWTSASSEKEQLITCEHLLTMTSGLDDSIGDNVSPQNLQYLADAGTRWAYHNVYVKLQDVVAETSNMTWSNYFESKIKNPIGMNGAWINTGDFSVYWSNTSSMARFGLLISANGKWNDEQIIPQDFLNNAINTSQNINQSYGYMWWLNGKSSFMLPQTQTQFNGELIPNAPNDMYCALGKNDQKIYIVPSRDLVIVRMGNPAYDENFALSSFDNELWEKINTIIQ